MTTAIEKETDMSNDNEIYPLERYFSDETQDINGGQDMIERSVNERLAPIFRALADDPDGWDKQCDDATIEKEWTGEVRLLPIDHEDCDHFRLVRKKPKTIPVEIPVPDHFSATYGNGGSVHLYYYNEKDSDNRVSEAIWLIRKAMEGRP